ncbi:MAG: radical SAM protein [Methanotrichaceae archaeon]
MNKSILKTANTDRDQQKRAEREQQKNAIIKEVGWAYNDLQWFSEEEAERAREQRSELLKDLSGWITYSFQGTKLHSGPLSPGCSICGNGGWDCNYITQKCSRKCFYCPQDRYVKDESGSISEGFSFRDPMAHISYLKTFQIKGVGFSGGEPLLVLDKLLSHIKAIRREFGSSIYLWVYTNGDFIYSDSLEKLRGVGLDEIRFDLSARDYDLSPVALSKEYIPTVTVEIPALPEDYDRLKDLMPKMEAIGVNHLNLHQLTTTEHNYKALIKRDYHFLHIPRIPVFESEMCALELLYFARQHQIKLPINYCCQVYKNRFQGRDIRTRKARAIQKGYEEITDAGYIRLLTIPGSTDKIESLAKSLVEKRCSSSLWQCNDKRTEIAIHSSLLPYLDRSSYDLSIFYLEPRIKLKDANAGIFEENIVPDNKLVHYGIGWSKIAIESWFRLYIQKMSYRDVSRYMAKHYPNKIKANGALSTSQKETGDLRKCTKWEELESGLSEVF